MSALAKLFSEADVAKRRVKDFLRSPLAAMQMIGDQQRRQWQEDPQAQAMNFFNPEAALSPLAGVMVGRKTMPAYAPIIDKAEKMHAAGASPEEIWEATAHMGYPAAKIPGTEASYGMEVPDDLAKIARGNSHFGDLAEILRHPTLTGMSDADVMFYGSKIPAMGSVTKVRIQKDFPNKGSYTSGGPFANIEVLGSNRQNALETLLHETQHRIAKHEGWPSGFSKASAEKWIRDPESAPEEIQVLISELIDQGVPQDRLAYQVYRKAAGEIPAWSTESRQPMTLNERVANPVFKEWDYQNAWNPGDVQTVNSPVSQEAFATGGPVTHNPNHYDSLLEALSQ